VKKKEPSVSKKERRRNGEKKKRKKRTWGKVDENPPVLGRRGNTGALKKGEESKEKEKHTDPGTERKILQRKKKEKLHQLWGRKRLLRQRPERVPTSAKKKDDFRAVGGKKGGE